MDITEGEGNGGKGDAQLRLDNEKRKRGDMNRANETRVKTNTFT